MCDMERRLEANAEKPLRLDSSLCVYFGSGMDSTVGYLTNFAQTECAFEFRERMWPSSEHAFQAHLRVHPDDHHHFAVGGKLSTLETGLQLVFKTGELDKKRKHYGPKKTGKPPMIGIVAKMAVNPEIAKKIGLKLISSSESKHSIAEVSETFFDLLKSKYGQCAEARRQLLATRGKHLVEFSRGAVREAKKGQLPLWTGQIDEHGILRGHNLQGELHMKVRDVMADKEQSM